MKLFRFGSIAVSLIVLAGFGCTDEKLSSGTYKLSQVSFSQDECNVRDNISEGHEVDLVVKENSITIHVANDLTPPSGVILGNTFMAMASKDSDMLPDTDCRDMWIKKMNGTLLRKDAFVAVYEFTDKTLSGADCPDEGKIGFHPPRCTSTVTFTATKK